ncbi:hypothetical protein IMSHALPRED_005756 [Imshaugia aleurites]|uniref:RRP15-like protein n=1 Tax=Imshaugia aleurites TaxID=172621 RepID=A0A8H3FE35_9LECA|nr:hypothetical protein IMSHALPRED_005756 [Imshaugia aleurites]
MAFVNAKRKRADGTHDDKTLNKSQKRQHSKATLLSPVDSAMQVRNRNNHMDDVANHSTIDDGNKHVASNASEASADKPPGTNLNSKAQSTSEPKSNEHTKQPIVEDRSEDGDDEDVGDEHEDKDEDEEISASLDRNLPPDEENYPLQDQEEDVPDPEDEEIKPAPLEVEAEAEAQSEDDWSASDAKSVPSSESSTSRASDAALDSDGEPHPDNPKKERFKADDPNAFASSMRGILGYKLTRTQRANPILARSADAKEADEVLLDMKLEKKARAEMKRQKDEKGGGYFDPNEMMRETHGEGAGGMVGSASYTDDVKEMGSISAYQQREKELRKMAQRGVVKMFNAFAHVREKTVEAQGLVGSRAKKQEKAAEMTKEGWLEYVGLGGKGEVEENGKSKVARKDGVSKVG